MRLFNATIQVIDEVYLIFDRYVNVSLKEKAHSIYYHFTVFRFIPHKEFLSDVRSKGNVVYIHRFVFC